MELITLIFSPVAPQPKVDHSWGF